MLRLQKMLILSKLWWSLADILSLVVGINVYSADAPIVSKSDGASWMAVCAPTFNTLDWKRSSLQLLFEQRFFDGKKYPPIKLNVLGPASIYQKTLDDVSKHVSYLFDGSGADICHLKSVFGNHVTPLTVIYNKTFLHKIICDFHNLKVHVKT